MLIRRRTLYSSHSLRDYLSSAFELKLFQRFENILPGHNLFFFAAIPEDWQKMSGLFTFFRSSNSRRQSSIGFCRSGCRTPHNGNVYDPVLRRSTSRMQRARYRLLVNTIKTIFLASEAVVDSRKSGYKASAFGFNSLEVEECWTASCKYMSQRISGF